MVPDMERDQRTLLVKAWDVNAYLAGDRDRYRAYYKAVRFVLASRMDPDLTVERLRELTLDHTDQLDPDAPEAQ